MNATLSRISINVLASVRQSTRMSRLRLVGTHSSSEKATTVAFPGPFHSTSIDLSNDRIPSEEEIQDGLKEWQAKISTEQLTDMEKRIHNSHMRAVDDQEEIYEDPVTGFHVYTSYGHIRRGSCCGNSCRHCPYDHHNVASRYKSVKKHNGAFYC